MISNLFRITLSCIFFAFFIYLLLFKQKPSLSSLINKSFSFRLSACQRDDKSDSIGPLGTFGMS